MLSGYILVLLVVLVVGVRISKKKEFHEDFLSLNITKGIQGFAAVAIMMHHLTQTVTQYGEINKGLITIFNEFGVLFAGTFFFLSGYGLFTSMETKPDYLKHFIRRRLPVVVIPFYIINWIFLILIPLSPQKLTLGINDWISMISGWMLLNKQLWYIVEIVILYIIFYILFRFLKNKNLSYALMGIFTVLITIGSLLLGHDMKTFTGGAWFHGEWWYNTTFLFFVGMTFAKFYKPITNFIKKYYIVVLFVGIVGFLLLFSAYRYVAGIAGYYCEWPGHPGYLEKFMTVGLQLPMVIFYVVTFLIITMKLQFKNSVLKFLGKISMELYMIHNIFIIIFSCIIKNDVLFFSAVYVASLVAAVILHYIDQLIINKIRK